ncbi:DUF262 domain-containing protein [Mesorhizobium sp. M0136]|uniref:GmrSD restriction endonuclease domain-containing protein n=1 Tax=Mesorhizobium sp. M0136 TaxID=2956890 RepID=UPI00333D9F56
MRDAQKPDHISLSTLVERLREGRYVIPDFQREFEWEPWDIRELMRSIFLDYYIGSLLLWRGSARSYADLSCEPVYGHEGSGKPEYIVLDGQQRLTAMHYAFLAPKINLPKKKNRAFYYMHVDRFMAEEHDEAFQYDWGWGKGPKILGDIEAQYRDHIFPFSLVGAGGWALPNWVQGYHKYWADTAANAVPGSEGAVTATLHAENAVTFGEHVKGVTQQFQISYVELDRELEIEKVCDIFTQINSRGVRLDVFDLMNALLKPKGLQLKQLWRDARKRLDFVDTPKMNVYVLQVMSILRQSYCSPKYLYFLLPGTERPFRDPDGTLRKEALVTSVEDFEARWKSAVDALEKAIKRLKHPQEFGVTSAGYLPYVSILPVFAALLNQVEQLPAEERLKGGRKLRHWYWASIFTNRYSGSVESTSARDFQDVRLWLEKDDAEPPLIGEFKTKLASLDLRTETKRGASIYNAVFNLLVIQGARDWITGNVPQPDELDDHHIVPSSWGLKNLSGQLGHTILNRTPLTAATNREAIRDRLPNAYLPELIKSIGRDEIEKIMASHFVSPAALDILLRNPFTPADYEAFITERQKTLTAAIESLLVKGRLDLPPDLRALDERMEKIELALRAAIATASGGDASRLPPHVLVKIDDRIKGELKKNPALDPEEMKSLTRRLEYADLRETQEALCGAGLWTVFESWFGTKPGLIGRFDQLAGLRNNIRHSRTVTDVTRKDGEAAILWFEDILKARAGEQARAA